MRLLLLFFFLSRISIAFGQDPLVVRLVDTSQVQSELFLKVAKGEKIKKRIIDQLYQQGYLNPELKNPKTDNDTLSYDFNPGKKYAYLKLATASVQSDLLEKDSVTVAIDQYQNFVSGLLDQLATKGRVFSKIRIDQLQIKNDSTLQGKLTIKKSKKRAISAIKIKGYEDFPVSYLKYYLGLKPSAIFDKKEIIKKSKSINELVFARQVKAPQVQFRKDSTLVYMYLQKEKSNQFEGFLGFTNDDQQELQLNGDVDLSLINNFNYGETFNLQYKNNGSNQEQFNLEAELPYLFKTAFSLNAGLDFFRQDSTYSTSTQHVKLNYQLNRRWRLKTGAQFNRSTSLQNEQPVVSDVSITDFKSDKFMLGTSFYLPTDIRTALPIKNCIDFEARTGERALLNTADNSSSSKNQFTFQLDNKWYIPINQRQFIYLGNFNRWLVSDDYVTNELFRFGGMKNIRGFPENSFFADFYSVLQTEYRYILSNDLFVHSVLDFSHFENQLQNTVTDLYSFGLGIGLQTQGGLLRLIVANGTQSGELPSFDQTQFHIRFSSLF